VHAPPLVDDPDRFDKLGVFLTDPALARGSGTKGLGKELSGAIDPGFAVGRHSAKLDGGAVRIGGKPRGRTRIERGRRGQGFTRVAGREGVDGRHR
jgi:hypothetical protein